MLYLLEELLEFLRSHASWLIPTLIGIYLVWDFFSLMGKVRRDEDERMRKRKVKAIKVLLFFIWAVPLMIIEGVLVGGAVFAILLIPLSLLGEYYANIIACIGFFIGFIFGAEDRLWPSWSGIRLFCIKRYGH